MYYKKFNATQLFTGTQLLDANAVLITDDKGVVENIISKEDAGDDIQHFSGTVCPGFINAHCHLELSHLKGVIPEKTGLADFVLQVIAKRQTDADQILEAVEKAENEMLAAGIVAVGDICNHTHSLTQKKAKRLHYHNFIEISGWNPDIAVTRMKKSLDYFHLFQALFPSRTGIVPHAPYSVSNLLWEMMQPYFDQQIITIHNQESKAENELFLSNSGDFKKLYQLMQVNNPSFQPTGKNSLPSYFHKLRKGKHVILVHNNFTTQSDIDFIQSTGTNVFWCLCPNANLYIENTLPPVDLLLQNKLNICIGTDSLASNHQLSVLEEIKTLQLHFPHVPLALLLQAATLNGAKALGMDDVLGSFEKGKKPGVILLENTSSITKLI